MLLASIQAPQGMLLCALLPLNTSSGDVAP
jgi:hypothetical protein